jgi:hypothetical protein
MKQNRSTLNSETIIKHSVNVAVKIPTLEVMNEGKLKQHDLFDDCAKINVFYYQFFINFLLQIINVYRNE